MQHKEEVPMKYIVALFLCCSVMAVEEIAQTVSTPVNVPVTFNLIGLNEGRGGEPSGTPNSIWVLRHIWNGLSTSDRTITRFAHPDGNVLFSTQYALLGNTPSQQFDFFNWNAGQAKPLTVQEVSADADQQATNGTLVAASGVFTPSDISGPKLTYTPNASFIGIEEIVFTYRSSVPTEYRKVKLTINVTNAAPIIQLSASPSLILAGGQVAFTPTFSDPEGHAVTISYDYGDGQTGNTAAHTYAAAGVYTVTATATDSFGATATAQTSVAVVGEDHLPTARFSTSAPAATIGEPVVFDAVFSTDPQNSHLTYAWDFGDGSPIGSGVTIAKEFSTAGSFNVTLTVTDGEGFKDSASLAFDITAAEEQFGVSFSSRVNRSKTGSDTLNVTARFVAGAPIAEGASVAVELAGTRFDATLDKKLRRTQSDAKWTVKKIRNKDVVELRLQAKKRTLGAGFESLGVTQANNRASIPVRVECAGKTLVVKTASEFKYNRPGTAFNGGGKSSN